MSRRFGRNQRRRMREQVAQLEEGRARDLGLLLEMRRERAGLLEELDDAKYRATRLSMLFPPATEEAKFKARTVRRWFAEMGRSLDDLMARGPGVEITQLLRRIPLEVIEASVDKDVLAGALHCRLHMMDNTVAYALTETAICAMTDEDLEKTILRVIGPGLVRAAIPYLRASSVRMSVIRRARG